MPEPLRRVWRRLSDRLFMQEVRIDGADRQGLERLFPYCARPIFAGEQLRWQEEDEMLIYHLRGITRLGSGISDHQIDINLRMQQGGLSIDTGNKEISGAFSHLG